MTIRHLLAVVCLVFPALTLRAGEPIAQGRPLSYWLLLLREGELRVDPAGPWESEVGLGPFRTSLALKSLGTEARSALPGLLAWFREDNGSVEGHRIKAAYLVAALRQVGCTDRRLDPLLHGLAALGDVPPDTTAKQRAQEIQSEATRLLAEFQSADRIDKRYEALAKLVKIAPQQARGGLPFLKELLLDPIAAGSTRYDEILNATPILQQLGLAAHEAAPLLEYRLRQESGADFAVALAVIAPDKAAPLLHKAPAALRKEVVDLLLKSETFQPGVGSLLADLLDDGRMSLDTAIAWVKLDPIKAKKTIPRFVAALDDLDPGIQLRAAAALLRIDPSRTRDVALVLRNIIRNYDGPTRDRARELLRPIGKEAIPALVELFDDSRWGYEVLEELPQFGADAKEAIPALRKLLSHKDRGHSVRAAWALAWIDPDSLKSTVSALIEAVDDPRAIVRQLALLTLGKIAAQNEKALTALAGKLGSKVHPDDVTAAVHALLALGEKAVTPLLERLADTDLQTRCNAAWVLAEIGPSANAALPALRKLLGEKEQIARVRAIYALARIDPKLDLELIEKVLLAGMERGDRTGREAALALGRLARVRDLTPTMGRALRSWPKGSVRAANAALALCALGPTAADRLPNLLSAIKATMDPRVADIPNAKEAHWRQVLVSQLLRATANIGPAASAVLRLLRVEGLRDDVEVALAALGRPDRKAFQELRSLLTDSFLRRRAIVLLGQMGATAREAVPDLRALDEFDAFDNVLTPQDAVLARVRAGVWPPESFFAEDSFGQSRLRDVELVQKAGKDVIPELVKLLEDERSSVRQAATYALGLAGAAAKEAAPRLAKMLWKDQSGIEPAITVALWQIRGPGVAVSDVVAALENMLEWKHWYQRAWAARRLGECGAAGRLAIPALRRRLDDLRSEVCIAAIETLGVLGASDKETIKSLSDVVQHEGKGARGTKVTLPALLLMGKIGPPAKEAFFSEDRWIPYVVFDTEARYNSMHRDLFLAAIRIDPKTTSKILARLVIRLKKEDHGTPEVIAMIGAEARKAVPDLMETYRKSRNSSFRREILAALSVLGPDNKETIPRLIRNARTDPDDAALLGAYGKLSKEGVPALLQGMKAQGFEFERGYSFIRPEWKGANYVDALGAIGLDARAAVPELLKLHEQWRKEPFIYLRIAAALKKIDPDAAHKAGIP